MGSLAYLLERDSYRDCVVGACVIESILFIGSYISVAHPESDDNII